MNLLNHHSHFDDLELKSHLKNQSRSISDHCRIPHHSHRVVSFSMMKTKPMKAHNKTNKRIVLVCCENDGGEVTLLDEIGI